MGISRLLGDGNCGEGKMGSRAGSGGPHSRGSRLQTLVECTDHLHAALQALGDTPTAQQTESDDRRHTPTDAPGSPPAESHPHPSNQTKTITCLYTNTHTPAQLQTDAELTAPDRADSHEHAGNSCPLLDTCELKGGKGPHHAALARVWTYKRDHF